jgi:hypothetical protein
MEEKDSKRCTMRAVLKYASKVVRPIYTQYKYMKKCFCAREKVARHDHLQENQSRHENIQTNV